MEKLQAALQKAKKARGETVGEPRQRLDARDLRARQTGGSIAADRLWQDLRSFEVPAEHLIEHRVVTQEAGPGAAPFDVLRTKVLLQMRQNGWKRLAITSPTPKSGKTTTACNLALGLGRQKDLRTILMDLDLRDPSIHSFFKINPPHGIGELLTGQAEFAEQAMRIGDNVACSMAQVSESDPTRMLLSEETRETIDRIEASYEPDVMIFDLPSVLVNDDTRAFLKNVDCALIVVRSDATRYGQLDVCEREIAEQTNVLGVVLNAFKHTSSKQLDASF